VKRKNKKTNRLWKGTWNAFQRQENMVRQLKTFLSTLANVFCGYVGKLIKIILKKEIMTYFRFLFLVIYEKNLR